jgi:geranylgeranyl pyrophosphate synthase
MVQDAMKERVKTSFLQEAAREDSRLWQNQSDIDKVNGKHKAHVNGSKAVLLSRVLGSSLHQHQLQQRQQQQQQGDKNEMNEPDLNGSTSATRNAFEQPLSDMLLLDAEPRYWPNLPPTVQPRSAENDPFALTKLEVDDLYRSIRDDLIGINGQQPNAILNEAASYLFQDDDAKGRGGGGKKFRPIMVMLLSRVLSEATATGAPAATTAASFTTPAKSSSCTGSLFGSVHDWQRPDLPAAQRRLAQVIEMIHAASLFHDDVIDKAETRRGRPSVHAVYGNKIAILAGDYLVGRTSVVLARLRNNDVFEAMSTIIEHLVRGEVMQMAKMTPTTSGITTSSGDGLRTNPIINGDGDNSADPCMQRLLYYLRKNFYKTGSLMAHTCRSAAMLGDYSDQLVAASYRYGKHMGMAFQLVDDILDFNSHGSQAQEHLGKPAAFSDLRAGLATAPVLFAALENPRLWQPLLHRQFGNVGDVDLAVSLMESSNGMERTKRLARVHAEKAMDAILEISSSSGSYNNNNCYRDALIHLALDVVSRTK